jgi:gamma-glutamyltranspeptidase/glutathione hydrolase
VVRSATGGAGAAATAHPAATDAAVEVLAAGGTGVDAAIAGQAVICVVMPQAAGLGGDVLALVHDGGDVHAVNGTGRSPRAMIGLPQASGGASVTVPGLVDGWLVLHERWGRLPLGRLLEPALLAAGHGAPLDDLLLQAVRAQRGRLLLGGARDWALLAATDASTARSWNQPQLARLLTEIAATGRDAFYAGHAAEATVAAVRACGGTLELADLAAHRTPCPEPVSVPWQEGRAFVQPPMSQGVLLAAALQKVASLHEAGVPIDDHILVETTQAAFAHRSSCARGAELLADDLVVDPTRATRRQGPRAYLHTAGVATSDRDGQVVSSLVSVFDDFGSGVFVPELGFVLNNRAAGFTDGENTAAPGKRPVHTLAPALLTTPDGVLGIATPGADGQVQTLLQVLTGMAEGRSLDDAVAALRWRSQDGDLLVEDGHPALEVLRARGHRVVASEPGSELFGAVVAAGWVDSTPVALADWRRQTNSGGAP